ncbi:MAG: CBS domain-containing protein [Bacteroidetes bacterium]|nr:CBS domain-containing protein [Bacteroidota bacterium]
MGNHNINTNSSLKQSFTKFLINDLKALEQMLANNLFENNKQRIGAEQEFCLIDYSLRPKMINQEMLAALSDEHFTTELAQFNLEANLDPLTFSKKAFSELENNLISLLTKANKNAHELGAKIILTGILPTIRKADISIENMTPNPRYMQLNNAILKARDDDFKFNISGTDQLVDSHDNVLYESCNTSFQIHFQIDPNRAADYMNWAQLISAPVLASCANSPIFMGKRLWQETRIALFQQSADTRKLKSSLRKEWSRVSFGNHWEKGTALDIFQEAVARFKILLPIEIQDDSLEQLKSGTIPKLKALSLHNGTIYKWNRLCYGVTNKKPHLRIENRYIPTGPTIVDEVANAAFWTGLMNNMPADIDSLTSKMEFDSAKNNFLAAAKLGLQTQIKWMDGEMYSAKDLVLAHLLPLAKEGLEKAKIAPSDIEKYLGIIEARVNTGQSGAQWMRSNYNALLQQKVKDPLVPLTEGIYQRQKLGMPVHLWPKLEPKEGGGWQNKYREVQQIMTRDLITVSKSDSLELARNMMLWSNIHHLPVEDKKGKLIGLLTSDKLLSICGTDKVTYQTTVGEVMMTELLTATPHMLSVEAYHIMRNNEIGSLPVLDNGNLVGIVTLTDFAKLMGFFFEEMEQG